MALEVLNNGNSTVVLTVPHKRIIKFRTHPLTVYRDQEDGLEELARQIAEDAGQTAVINETLTDMNSEFDFFPDDISNKERFFNQIKELNPKLVIDLHGMADVGAMLLNPNRDGLPVIRRYDDKPAKGFRPDVDIEWRRKHGMTTTKGVVVTSLGKFMALKGFDVGYEDVYPGGQLIAKVVNFATDALAIEIRRTVRTQSALRERLGMGISNFVKYYLGEEVDENFDQSDFPDVEEQTVEAEAAGQIPQHPRRLQGQLQKDQVDRTDYIG